MNRFAGVYRALDNLEKMCEGRDQSGLSGEVLKIKKMYTKIAGEVLNENR